MPYCWRLHQGVTGDPVFRMWEPAPLAIVQENVAVKAAAQHGLPRTCAGFKDIEAKPLN